jgi:hypothetical protein
MIPLRVTYMRSKRLIRKKNTEGAIGLYKIALLTSGLKNLARKAAIA